MSTDTPPPLEPHDVRAYLQRLGFDRAPAPDSAGLRALHRAHLRSIPFENLDIHIGRPIRLELGPLVNKLLHEVRGGYCYELNGAFASLLTSIGFDVSILEARVYGGEDVGIRFDHACLRVEMDRPRLVDVGFGASFHEPILLTAGSDQRDPGGTYRLEERDDGWLDLSENGQRQYRLSLTPRSLNDFEDANRHQQTSPESHFTHNTICSLATPGGRVTIRGLQLIETGKDQRSETILEPQQLGPALDDHFGIALGGQDLERLVQSS